MRARGSILFLALGACANAATTTPCRYAGVTGNAAYRVGDPALLCLTVGNRTAVFSPQVDALSNIQVAGCE